MGSEKVSVLWIILLYCLCQVMLVNAADPAVTPGAKGAAVVQDVVKKIKNSGVFREDYGFLARIAQVESRCGDDKNTYRDGYHGGIWQVDKDTAFNDTKLTGSHPKLTEKYEKIKKALDIDWPSVTWEDLRKPLYSGLAARLYLSNIEEPIPKSLKDQAVYWKNHYNSHHQNAKGTVQDFIDRVSTVKGDPHVTQLVTGSDIPLCYDVFGDDGSIYNLLSDNDMGIKIHARLESKKKKRVNKQHIAKYLGEVAATIGSHTFLVNKNRATINNSHYVWKQHTDIQLDGIRFQTNKKGMRIDFMGLLWFDVTKHRESFLNIEIHHLGTFSKETYGILGDVANNVKIVEANSGADLHLTSDETSIIHLTKNKSCWKMPRHLPSLGQGFEELVLRNKIGCMLC